MSVFSYNNTVMLISVTFKGVFRDGFENNVYKPKTSDHKNTRSRQKQFYFSAQTEDRGQHSFGVVIIIYTVMKS